MTRDADLALFSVGGCACWICAFGVAAGSAQPRPGENRRVVYSARAEQFIDPTLFQELEKEGFLRQLWR